MRPFGVKGSRHPETDIAKTCYLYRSKRRVLYLGHGCIGDFFWSRERRTVRPSPPCDHSNIAPQQHLQLGIAIKQHWLGVATNMFFLFCTSLSQYDLSGFAYLVDCVMSAIANRVQTRVYMHTRIHHVTSMADPGGG